MMNPKGLLPLSVADREIDYHNVASELGAFGSPDVMVLGSSHARRAISAPHLRDALNADARGLRIANFSLGGARAEEVEAVIHRLVETQSLPKLVIWPFSPLELQRRRVHPAAQAGYNWHVEDWWLARTRGEEEPDRLLPGAIRNQIATVSLLMRYRFFVQSVLEAPLSKIGRKIGKMLRPSGTEAGPMRGDLHPSFRRSNAKAAGRVTRQQALKRVQAVIQEPGWPARGHQAMHVEGGLATLRKAGIPVLLLELPLHPTFEKLTTPRTLSRMRKYLAREAKRFDARFVPLSALNQSFSARDFTDSSHANLRGAMKYTRAIARVVGEELK
jgi:hypothetical protein